jgi:hypothetical protein
MPTSTIQGSDGDQFKVHTTQQLSLGQQMHFPDGRTFRYSRADPSTAVVVAKCYQAAVPAADNVHALITPAAAAVGDRTITVTLGAGAVAADVFRDGYLTVDLVGNTGFGYMYQIGPHGDLAASVAATIPIRGSVQVAIATTANSVSLVRNPYADIVLTAATAPTAMVVGISVKPIPVSNFGWIQTSGNCMCLTEGTVVIGQQLIPAVTATGAVVVQSTAESLTVPTIATVTRVAIDTSYSTINLIGVS